MESVLVPALVGCLGVVLVSLYFRKAGEGRTSLFSTRSEQNLHDIYRTHFAATQVSEEKFLGLWIELAEILEVPPGKLLPSDRFRVELSPPSGYEFNDQIKDVMYVIGRNCNRTGVKPEQIQTMRDFVVAFGSH